MFPHELNENLCSLYWDIDLGLSHNQELLYKDIMSDASLPQLTLRTNFFGIFNVDLNEKNENRFSQ